MAKAAALHAPLTDRQHQTLATIDMLQRQKGYSPTIREVQESIGASSPSNIHDWLVILRDYGLVTWVVDSPRTLVITQAGRKAL